MNSLIVKTFFFALVAGVTAVPASQQRIVGGSLTTINNYPFAAPLLFSSDLVNFRQGCAATIITVRTAMCTASCVYGDGVNRWRLRVGSTYANSGGVVHSISSILIHPSYNPNTFNYDVSLIKTSTPINYVNGAVQPASIAGPNYNLPDNQPVWTLGWGATAVGGAGSEQLRHVQIWTINQQTCRQRYSNVGTALTDSMMCAGWLDVGGRGPCAGDNGSPLMHNNAVVGLDSFQLNCALPFYPSVFTFIAKVSGWISSNA